MFYLGIVFGLIVGGVVIEKLFVMYNVWVGGGFIILVLFCVIFLIMRGCFI